MTIFFKPFARAVDHLEPVVDMLLDLWCHISISHLDTVDLCLMLEQFLHSDLLRDHTVRIAIPLHSFHRSLHTVCLYVGLQDGLIAHDPDDLVDDGAHVYGVTVSRTSVTSLTSKTSITTTISKTRGRPEDGETYEQGYDVISCLHQCRFTVFNTSSYIFTG